MITTECDYRAGRGKGEWGVGNEQDEETICHGRQVVQSNLLEAVDDLLIPVGGVDPWKNDLGHHLQVVCVVHAALPLLWRETVKRHALS